MKRVAILSGCSNLASNLAAIGGWVEKITLGLGCPLILQPWVKSPARDNEI
jgi:hypothetical protein